MNELIKITYDNDTPRVSARELHGFLEVGTKYQDWFPRMCEYGFSPGEDFNLLKNEKVQIEGSRAVTRHIDDAALTIDMAKEICMLQRNEKGKQARQYFIQLEKDWNSPEKVMARALQIADRKIRYLSDENAQQKQLLAEFSPKASYYDVVLQTKDAIAISVIAKDYGKSAKWLNKLLHEKGIQFKQGRTWLLYQKHAEQGYTKSKTEVYSKPDGTQGTNIHTYWTQKGRLFIYDLLKADGILPLIELKQEDAVG